MSNYNSIANGLYLNFNANIYTQGSTISGTSNSWNDGYASSSGPPWSIYSASTAPSPPNNIFYVTAASLGTPGDPKNRGGYVVTFSPGAGTDCFVCSGFPPCSTVACNTCVIGVANSIIHSDIVYSPYSTATHWLEKFELYSSVLADDTTYIDSSTMLVATSVHNL